MSASDIQLLIIFGVATLLALSFGAIAIYQDYREKHLSKKG